MPKCLAALLSFLLCSCGSINQTKNPAASYRATEVQRGKSGALLVVGEGSPAYLSTTIAIPTLVLCGLQARVSKAGVSYACYQLVSKYDMKASSLSLSPDDFVDSVKLLPCTRAAFDTAAAGAGLTVPMPEWHTQHTFSAAYVSGFLQKVDETIRDPAAAKIVHY